jgi:hypothetical protein
MDDTTKLRNELVTAGRLDLLDLLEDVLLDEYAKGVEDGRTSA